jgi:hypothetical protein
MQGNRGDSQLLVLGNQIGNLTTNPSFSHNLCFKCPNGSCEPILKLFNDIMNFSIQWVLTYTIALWKFGNPSRLQLPKWELTWSVGVHSLTLSKPWDVTLGLPSWPHPHKPLPWSWAQGNCDKTFIFQ